MMNNENYIWEKGGFHKDPYHLPEGYFTDFPDRMLDLVRQSDILAAREKKSMIRPWMAWASGIAAVLTIGWFGVRTYYWKPMQEVRFQESIALMVDFYDGELHEDQLAGYFEENKIDLVKQSGNEVNALIQIEPDLAEEYIYETVGL
ncbi:MAG: hypothetical protein WC699_08860 [Bacteroidales bacterium]|jgi:hypothetical protein